jgi:hypothetical protein
VQKERNILRNKIIEIFGKSFEVGFRNEYCLDMTRGPPWTSDSTSECPLLELALVLKYFSQLGSLAIMTSVGGFL